MPLSRPTFTAILDRVKSDIRGEFTGAVPAFRRMVEYGFSRAIAGASHMLHAHVDWAVRQMFIEDADRQYAMQWANVILGGINGAVAATGSVTFTGVNGSPISTGEEIKRADGLSYTVDSPGGTISGGTATLPVTATIPSADGNSDAATVLTFVSTPTDVDAEGTVAAGGLVGGADEETREGMILRILERFQNPPMGGGPGDYVRWALASDITVARAWQVPIYPTSGQVLVLVLDASDGSPSGLANVAPYVEARRPETADVTVQAATVQAVPVTITGLTPDTAAIRTAVEAEMEDMFTRAAADKVGVYSVAASQISGSISQADGEQSHTLTVPAGATQADAETVLVLGTVTYA